MARFFIDRPIFAWVIAIIIMLAGGLAITQLPISMYPNIAPPAVTISANYPGASAKVVQDAVTQIIERNMKGLDGLIYMSATSDASGNASITLTFESGTDPDIAQVQVQNKLQLAMPSLPQEVQRQGVNVTKSRSGFLMVIAFVSKDGSMTRDDISDYVGASLVDPLSRVPGVGTVQLFGSPYAMRIWLDPNKLETYGLAVGDIITAVRAQNAQVTIGQLGGAPSVEGQQLNATISAQERLHTPEQFRGIVLRSNPDGSVLKLGDVARVEIGAETYEFVSRYNGQPASGVAISLATGANALETAAGVEQALDGLDRISRLLEAVIPFDTTPFVRMSIKGVITAGRGDRARVPRHLPRPPELPRHADPHHRRARGAARDDGRAGPARLLDQHAHDVRHGAGDRPARGRRHRRGRERRARDARGGTVASRSHAQFHAGDHRRARRYRHGARGGVRADGVHARFDRRDLPAVFRDDRVGHVVVGAGRDRAHAGAVRDDTEAGAQGRAPRGTGFLGSFDRPFDRGRAAYRTASAASSRAAAASCSSSPLWSS